MESIRIPVIDVPFLYNAIDKGAAIKHINHEDNGDAEVVFETTADKTAFEQVFHSEVTAWHKFLDTVKDEITEDSVH